MRLVDDTHVLKSVTIVDGKTIENEFRVRDFIRHIIRVGQQFNSNYDGMRLQGRIDESLDGSGILELEVGDWEKVCEAVKNPSPIQGFSSYPIQPSHKCIPFVVAILEATVKRESLK